MGLWTGSSSKKGEPLHYASLAQSSGMGIMTEKTSESKFSDVG